MMTRLFFTLAFTSVLGCSPTVTVGNAGGAGGAAPVGVGTHQGPGGAPPSGPGVGAGVATSCASTDTGPGPQTSTGTTTPTSTSTGPMDCGTPLFIEACESCVMTGCCGQQKACDQGTDCYNLLACEVNGGTVSQCEAMFPAGTSPLMDLEGCLSSTCAAGCGVSCSTNFIEYPDQDVCNGCISANCCSEFTALSEDVSGTPDPNCTSGGDFSACPPIADFDACGHHPHSAQCSGDMDAQNASACQKANCPGCSGDL